MKSEFVSNSTAIVFCRCTALASKFWAASSSRRYWALSPPARHSATAQPALGSVAIFHSRSQFRNACLASGFFFFLPPCAVRYATYVRRDWQNLMCHRTARRAAMGRSTPVRRLRSPSQRPAPCIQWLDARGNTAVMVMIAAEIYKLYTHVATPAGQYLTCVV